MNSFYSKEELKDLNLKSYGEQVRISRKASIYSPNSLSIGDNVRIDDFCIISGNITLGSHIHISAYTALYGANGIVLKDYTGISPRCSIFSAIDDFSGGYLVGPVHNEEYTNVVGGEVIICRYSHIGTNSVIFPGLTVGEGCAVGAMTFVNKSLDAWGIYAGIPAKRIKERNKGLLKFVNK